MLHYAQIGAIHWKSFIRMLKVCIATLPFVKLIFTKPYGLNNFNDTDSGKVNFISLDMLTEMTITIMKFVPNEIRVIICIIVFQPKDRKFSRNLECNPSAKETDQSPISSKCNNGTVHKKSIGDNDNTMNSDMLQEMVQELIVKIESMDRSFEASQIISKHHYSKVDKLCEDVSNLKKDLLTMKHTSTMIHVRKNNVDLVSHK